MKITELIRSNFSKIKKAGEKRISKNMLTGSMWVLIDDTDDETLYIFKEDNSLLISINGKITRCTYEFIIDNDTIIIDNTIEEVLYYLALVGDDFLVLNHSYEDMVLAFANKTKFKDKVKKVLKLIFEQKINPYLKTSSTSSKPLRTNTEIEVEANYSTENIIQQLKSESKTQFNLDQYEQALDSCNKVLDIRSDDLDCRVRKCLCLANLGRGIECHQELVDFKHLFVKLINNISGVKPFFNFFMSCSEGLIMREQWNHAKKISDYFFQYHTIDVNKELEFDKLAILVAIYAYHDQMEKIYDIFLHLTKSNCLSLHKKLKNEVDTYISNPNKSLKEFLALDFKVFFSRKKQLAILSRYFAPKQSEHQSRIAKIEKIEMYSASSINEFLENSGSIIDNLHEELFNELEYESRLKNGDKTKIRELTYVLQDSNCKIPKFIELVEKQESKEVDRNFSVYLIIGLILVAISIFFAKIFYDTLQTENPQEIKKNVEQVKQNNDNYKNLIRGYVKATDDRDLATLSTYLAQEMKQYWKLQNPQLSDVQEEIKRVWSFSKQSHNEIQSIESGNEEKTFFVNTIFYYETNSGKQDTVYSKVKYVFDDEVKIVLINGVK